MCEMLTVLAAGSVPARQTAAAAGRRVAGQCVLAALAAQRAVVSVAVSVARPVAARTCPAETTPARTCDWIARRRAGRTVAHAAAVDAEPSLLAL